MKTIDVRNNLRYNNKKFRRMTRRDREVRMDFRELSHIMAIAKYKNIVLRPYKIQKENQLKNNIKVNKYEVDDSPKIINKIMTRLNIKPKYSRVFKYK